MEAHPDVWGPSDVVWVQVSFGFEIDYYDFDCFDIRLYYFRGFLCYYYSLWLHLDCHDLPDRLDRQQRPGGWRQLLRRLERLLKQQQRQLGVVRNHRWRSKFRLPT